MINNISGRWSPGLNEDVDALGYGGNPRSINNVLRGVSNAAQICGSANMILFLSEITSIILLGKAECCVSALMTIIQETILER